MGMSEDINQIKELLEKDKEKPKEKKFNFPFGKKVSNSQAKKNWITVLKLNENGAYEFSKKQIDEQTIMVDGVPRIATAENLWIGKSPLMILPSWSVKPVNNEIFNPIVKEDNLDEDGKANTKGYKILMARMKSETVTDKKPMGGWVKWVIGIFVLGIIGYAIISGGSG